MTDSHHAAPAPQQRLFALLKPERADIWLIVTFSLVTGVLNLASPLAVDAVVNNISFGGQQPVYLQSLLVLCGALFVFLTAYATISVVQYYVVELIQQRIFVRLATDLSLRLPRLQYGALERTRRPEIVNKFLDVVTVQKSSAHLLLDGINVSLAALIGLVVLAFYHPFLLAFDFVLILGLLVVIFVLGRRGVSTSVQESYAKHAVAGWLEQVVMFPLVFKSPAAARLTRERTDQLVDTYITARRAHFRILARQIVGLLALEAIASAMLLALGGQLVLQGQITLGQLVASELIVAAIVASIVRLGKHFENWYDTLAAIDKLGSVVDLPIEASHHEPTGHPEGPAPLVIENLAFAYPNSRHLFENVSLTVSPSERVAVTGPIGSGAGTLLDVIYGLRPPSEGSLRIRGVDIRSWDIYELRHQVVLVREPDFIEASLAENIRLGCSELSDSEIQAVLDRVGLGPMVSRAPDGIRMHIHAGGRPLSDAQRILAVLARAIAARPSLLLIDKVLDGLDPDESEAVLSVLFDPNQPWSLLVATRDAGILHRCSRILRLRCQHEERTEQTRAIVETKVPAPSAAPPTPPTTPTA